MKKGILAVCVFLFSLSVFAEGNFVDYIESLNLTAEKREKIEQIKLEEENALKPFILDISAKEEGIKSLKELKCDFFDSACKEKLKENIAQIEFERDEILKKIGYKKAYFEVKYKNVLTREELLSIEKKREFVIKKDKVDKEEQKKAEIQARKEKLKVWKKFQKNSNQKLQKTKKKSAKPQKPPKGEITGH